MANSLICPMQPEPPLLGAAFKNVVPAGENSLRHSHVVLGKAAANADRRRIPIYAEVYLYTPRSK